MPVLKVISAAVVVCCGLPLLACAQTVAPPLPFEKLAAACAPSIHPTTLKAVVTTESSWNPYAIGVVAGRLDRQPRSLDEAIATARELKRQGFNFSLGLGQVNRYNLARYGATYETVFDPCRNLQAGAAILQDCFVHAKKRLGDDQQALRAAFSCYYSGNFTRGFRPDQAGQPSYVQKVVANATHEAPPIPVVPAVRPQSSDGALAVRPAGRLPSRPASQTQVAATPAPWVIFADGPQPGAQSAEQSHAAPAKESPVKVRPAVPSSSRQSAPFVQLVN